MQDDSKLIRNPPNHWDSMADYLMKQFIKSPVTVFNKVNLRKPTLTFNGSNWSEWESAINWTLQHAFLSNKSFIGNDNPFSVMNLVQNQVVTSLIRNTLDSALLSIVKSGGLASSKDLFDLLKPQCKRLGCQHKLILVEKILKFASNRQPASKSWLETFCATVGRYVLQMENYACNVTFYVTLHCKENLLNCCKLTCRTLEFDSSFTRGAQ
ncbi:hypothetical protein PCASD_03440 [Puccinia coronata f. sp. avenae]|uniref:Uncharacterized protein n=1 Tax=Puccinia coronata f. sp. avenae TaxID=200324 RepID=A0A2N5VF67_9BASI|nr:hypothetical protein PCASD_03440 [Puccinia coronata f. sp. avenae]